MKKKIISYSSGTMSFLAFLVDNGNTEMYLLAFNTVCIQKTFAKLKSKVKLKLLNPRVLRGGLLLLRVWIQLHGTLPHVSSVWAPQVQGWTAEVPSVRLQAANTGCSLSPRPSPHRV